MICKTLYLKALMIIFTLFSPKVWALSDPQEKSPALSYYELAAREMNFSLQEKSIFQVENVDDFILALSKRADCPESFYVINLSKLEDRLQLWHSSLPSVEPFYAVKTNHDPMLVSHLARMGLSFDCASTGEIHQLLELGVDSSRMIYTHPRKQKSSLVLAQEVGVQTYVFDSLEELEKMAAYCPDGQYVIRIATDDRYSSSPLSQKFGASISQAKEILDQAFSKKLNVVGVAFHVGSNCWHLPSYLKAIEDSKELFDYAHEKWSVDLTLLDIGGGWPGAQDEVFKELAEGVENALSTHFNSGVRIIAEPGRFFSASSMTSVVSILGKSIENTGRDKRIAYYLSDGIFGLFITSLYYQYDSQLIDKEGWNFKPLVPKPNSTSYPSKFWGVTCDSSDKIYEEIEFPELETGDYIYSHNTGAYTCSVQTNFNQVPHSFPFYVQEI